MSCQVCTSYLKTVRCSRTQRCALASLSKCRSLKLLLQMYECARPQACGDHLLLSCHSSFALPSRSFLPDTDQPPPSSCRSGRHSTASQMPRTIILWQQNELQGRSWDQGCLNQTVASTRHISAPQTSTRHHQAT